MELPGLNPLGSMAAFAAEAPGRKLQQTTRVGAAAQSGGSATDSRKHPSQPETTAEARDLTALRREMERQALPAGPPPAFRISLLEAESGMDQALARIEAARTHERDGPALRMSPDPVAQALAADAPAPDEPAPTPVTQPQQTPQTGASAGPPRQSM